VTSARAVLDPGVLVAALLSPGGSPAALIDRWTRGDFEVIVSPMLLAELARVLARPKFRGYVTPGEVETYVRFVTRNAVRVEDPPTERCVPQDPGDDCLVCLARAAGATVLVTGDAHLLGATGLEALVAAPRAFLERLA
jgi:putative PIN family toxin of toxin-antitoxin system